jgi:tetratricopeptide (TPR) repeat protein
MQSFALVSQGYDLLVKAWSKLPNDPAMVTAMGVVRLGTGDAPGAEALFAKVIQMTPNDAPSYVHAALAWHMMRNNDKAIQCLNKALQLDPLEQQPYRNLAAIYTEENDPDKVRQTYERFLKAFPQSIEAQSYIEKTERIAPLPAISGSKAGAH